MLLRYREGDGFAWRRVRERSPGGDLPAPVETNIDPDRAGRTVPLQHLHDAASVARFPAAYRAMFEGLRGGTLRIPEGLRVPFPAELARMFAEWPEYHLGSMPLTVLSATRRSPSPDEVWSTGRLVAETERLQRDLATRSDRARLEWVESGHAIHLDAPEIVVRAIEAAVTPGG